MKFTMKVLDKSITGDEVIDRVVEIDGEKLKGWVTQVWKGVFGKEPKIRISDNPVGDEDVPDFSLIIEDTFTIYPGNVKLTNSEMGEGTIEVGPLRSKQIGALAQDRVKEVGRWVLDVAIPEHNYPTEPDEVDVVDLAYSTEFSALVDMMILAMAKHDMGNVWELIGMEQMIADEEKYDADMEHGMI
jgi:hypothetical protein